MLLLLLLLLLRTIRSMVTLLALLSVFSLQPAHTQSCDCDVSPRKERAYDALLELDETEKAEAEAIHFLWGVPTSPNAATNEHLLHQAHYIVDYDDDLRLPLWAGYRLRGEDVTIRRERTECFRRDVRLGSDVAAFCEDYQEPVFDRGHMVPNADMTLSEAAMINTYMFSNMVPQHDKFNRGIWARLEGFVRDWAALRGEIYVITGAIFDKDSDGTRDSDSDATLMAPRNRVAVPTHFYKIILHERPDGFIESMSFLLPHEDKSASGRAGERFLEERLTSIDAIEALTGIDFLSALGMQNPTKEAAVERFKANRMWPRN